VPPREEQRLVHLVEPSAQRHAHEEDAVGVRVRALLGHLRHHGAAHHPEDLVAHVTPVRHVDQPPEANVRLGRFGSGAERVVAGHVAVLVDDPRAAVAVDDVRIGVEDGDAPLEVGRQAHVVVRVPLEVLAARGAEAAVVVFRRPEVPRAAGVADARVACGVLAADVFGGVGRRVVADDQLEVAEGLPEQRVDRLADEPRAVAHRHANAGAWRPLAVHKFLRALSRSANVGTAH
jgi:hypothetical protein